MMKNILFILTFLVVHLHASESICEMPKETILFQFPDHSEANWKKIVHHVNAKDGVVEMIPINQSAKNISELITIQYIGSAIWNKSLCTLEEVLNHMCNEVFATHPKGSVFSQILEKDQEGITYEWIYQADKNRPFEHEISRAFLTETGFHRIAFVQKNRPITSEEKAKWVELLKENSSVVPFQNERCLQGFSLVEKVQHTVSLGAHFQNWKSMQVFNAEIGLSLVYHVPLTQKGISSAERLEIFTVPKLDRVSLASAFELEKQAIKKTSKKVKFHILEQSPTELIYYYQHPEEHLQLNAIVRNFLTDHGYYSISYKKRLEGPMQKEEFQACLEKIKTIKVQAPSKSIKVSM